MKLDEEVEVCQAAHVPQCINELLRRDLHAWTIYIETPPYLCFKAIDGGSSILAAHVDASKDHIPKCGCMHCDARLTPHDCKINRSQRLSNVQLMHNGTRGSSPRRTGVSR